MTFDLASVRISGRAENQEIDRAYIMRTEELNEPIFDLDDSHPAKRFLDAFIECKSDCVGRQYDFEGQSPIEQRWRSASDGRPWTFSGFAYGYLSRDIVLDGFLDNIPYLTESETADAEQLPAMRTLMNECADAARQSGNSEILELTDQVLQMLDLWQQYLSFRKGMISNAR